MDTSLTCFRRVRNQYRSMPLFLAACAVAAVSSSLPAAAPAEVVVSASGMALGKHSPFLQGVTAYGSPDFEDTVAQQLVRELDIRTIGVQASLNATIRLLRCCCCCCCCCSGGKRYGAPARIISAGPIEPGANMYPFSSLFSLPSAPHTLHLAGQYPIFRP